MKKGGFVILMCFSFFLTKGQTCPSQNPWEWPSHRNWFSSANLWTGQVRNMLTGTTATVGITGTEKVSAYEGVSGASDDNGNLLFYTNGRRLWTGTGASTVLKFGGLLEGNENGATTNNGSAAQGVITVRHPLNPNDYYVFTTDDAVGGSTLGFNYCVFDKNGTLQSGPTRLGNYRTTEGVAATIHANGTDIWITVTGSGTSTFYTYLLTCTGLILTPVTSPAPPINGNYERGGLAFSWDSKYFAAAHPNAFPNTGTEVSVYKFDNNTGLISDPHYITDPAVHDNPYDVLFSPDNSKVYVSLQNKSIVYYDITSWNTATMTASRTSTGVTTTYNAIEIGPDGNLYATSSPNGSLRQLTGNLNSGGTFTAANVAGAVTSYGLPTMYLPPQEEPDIQEVGPYCTTDAAVDLSTLWFCSGLNAEDPNGTPPSVYTASCGACINAATGVFDPSAAGVGTHEIIFTKCSVDDTIWITVNNCNTTCLDTSLKSSSPICLPGNFDLNTLTKPSTAPGTWSIQGAGVNWPTLTGNIFTTSLTTAPGLYTVRYSLNPVPVDPACPTYAERVIKVSAKPDVILQNKTICDGDAAVIFDAGPGFTYLWSSGEIVQSISKTAVGTYTVYVTDANSCKDTATATLTVNSKPDISLADQTICSGDAAVSFDAGAGFASYNWNNGAGNLQTFSTNAGGVYIVIVTDANICRDTASATLTIMTKPNISLANQSICEGATATFDATVGFTNYLWSGAASGAAQTITGTTAGNYQVIVTNAGGCKDTASATLTVNDLPIIAISDQTICPGNSTTLDAGAGFSSYSWSPGGASTSSITVNAGGTYTVTVTDANGCSNSDAASVTVNPNLIIDLGPDQTICQGSTATFTVNYAGAGVIYNWNNVPGTKTLSVSTAGTYHADVIDPLGCQGQDDVTLTVNPLPEPSIADAQICAGENHVFDAGSYNDYQWLSGETTSSISKSAAGIYTVTVTDVNGCSADASATLTLNPNPTVELVDYIGCEGTTATFYAANNGAKYLWSNGDTTQSISVSSDGNYSVTVIDANSCEGYDTATASFVVIPQLEIGPDVNLCEGESAIITANVVPQNAVLLWSTGENNVSNISVSSAGKIVAKATNGGLCSAEDSLLVDIHESPKVIKMHDTTLCFFQMPNGYILDAGSTAVNYVWSNGQTGQTITVTEDGRYDVTLSNEYGCASSSSVTISEDCPSSLFVPNAFTPNGDGTNDIFYAAGENIYDFEIWIFDRWGEVIYHSTDRSEGWNGRRNNTLNDAQIDVYVWKIDYKYWSDWKNKSRKRTDIGRVTIVR